MFVTERLFLRPFAEPDIAMIYHLVYADPAVRMAWSTFDGSLDAFATRFHTASNWRIINGFGYWAVTRAADHHLLGLMGFQNHADEPMDWLVMPDGSRNVGHIPGCLDAELTYAFGRAYWQRGYAAEAGHRLLAYGFQQLAIDRVINAISPTNHRSYALMLRLGFTFVHNGNPEDVIGVLENPHRVTR